MQATATHEDGARRPARRRRASAAGADALTADLYALFMHLNKSCSADLFAAMSELELSITQLKLLHRLELADRELTVKEAAAAVLLSVAAMSRTLDDLVQRGLVERHEDAEDRRMKRVGLTEAGRRAIRTVSEARLAGLEQFTRTLSEEERQALAAALNTLMRRDDLASCRPDRSKAR